MFNVFLMLYWICDWFGWVEVLCELVICDLLDMDVELCRVLLTWVKIMRFQALPKFVLVKP